MPTTTSKAFKRPHKVKGARPRSVSAGLFEEAVQSRRSPEPQMGAPAIPRQKRRKNRSISFDDAALGGYVNPNQGVRRLLVRVNFVEYVISSGIDSHLLFSLLE